MVLSPEEMMVYLATRASRHEHERMFRLCSLVEFFRLYRGPIKWQDAADMARQRGVDHEARASLWMVYTLLDRPIPVDDLERFGRADEHLRILQWARYGPAYMERYTSFKGLFFCLLSFFSTKGFGAKLKYLGKTRGAFLMCVSYATRLGAKLLISTLRRQSRYVATDFAYWTEPEPKVTPTDRTGDP
jgi:hypothetical protein